MPAPQAAIEAYRAGKLEAAESMLRRALAKAPTDAESNMVLGVVLCGLGRLDQAEFALRRAIAARPEDARPHANLGNMLVMAGRPAEAKGCFEKAISLNDQLAVAWLGLAPVLHTLCEIDGSIAAARRALELAPVDPSARVNLASALVGGGGEANITEAIAILRQSIALAPGKAGLVANHMMTLHYDPTRTARQIFDEHVEYGRRFVAAVVSAGATVNDSLGFGNSPDPERPIRVGFLTSDFRAHVVACFAEGFLREHDRERVKLFVYMNSPMDKVSERLKKLCEGWVQIKDMPDEQVVERVRKDGIDILVDLNGHTDGARQALLVRRMAPVQATYIGYPDTTGLPTMDYRIVDTVTDPMPAPGEPELATEKLLRLKRSFLHFSPPADAPAVGPLPAVRNGHITFGCLNASAKINESQLRTFAAVLHAVPGSRLIIKNRAQSSASLREMAMKPMRELGIEDGRVEMVGWKTAMSHHLDVYNLIDIALDSYPYTGTTTTCEALWMGVPVVSRAGIGHVSRVSASILTRVGLTELIATDAEDFVRAAARCASDVAELGTLRGELRERVCQSELGDAKGMARALEEAYRTMWRAWCERKRAATPAA